MPALTDAKEDAAVDYVGVQKKVAKAFRDLDRRQ